MQAGCLSTLGKSLLVFPSDRSAVAVPLCWDDAATQSALFCRQLRAVSKEPSGRLLNIWQATKFPRRKPHFYNTGDQNQMDWKIIESNKICVTFAKEISRSLWHKKIYKKKKNSQSKMPTGYTDTSSLWLKLWKHFHLWGTLSWLITAAGRCTQASSTRIINATEGVIITNSGGRRRLQTE